MPTTATQDVSYSCRLLRHAWKLMKPSDPRLSDYEHHRLYRNVLHLECLRCPTLRHDSFDTNGHLQHRKYDYPDDYRMDEEERPTQEQLRLWMMKKSMAQFKKGRAVQSVPDLEQTG